MSPLYIVLSILYSVQLDKINRLCKYITEDNAYTYVPKNKRSPRWLMSQSQRPIMRLSCKPNNIIQLSLLYEEINQDKWDSRWIEMSREYLFSYWTVWKSVWSKRPQCHLLKKHWIIACQQFYIVQGVTKKKENTGNSGIPKKLMVCRKQNVNDAN